MRIIFEDEITVIYDCWHDHYWGYADSNKFEILKENVLKRQIERFLKAGKNWMHQAKTYGVEARIVYWDETKNQTVVFAPGED